MNVVQRFAGVGAAALMLTGVGAVAAPGAHASTAPSAVVAGPWNDDNCRFDYSNPTIWINHGYPASAVKQAQCLLNYAGYNLAIDGSFGTRTRDAVISFQGRQRIDNNGVVGPITWGRLYSYQ
ncbi:peptidoglycan-binding domain-containing protein [Luteipulveratus sp. YIM 133132]|uniref:Peptidoglycan-binding domain-containing protein n=1 Tax=Luteipulveratus flavus TaxID=3031728 RepID=A0ABT6C565_9MICO|nr:MULTISPECIES: peptidoglycan-binding domain-containing protein [unclassified Luteipulveratus]MDE9365354.1 peptidoglycan-binding domain-containing protein [Luteipulveratus sp. YIM 133132]MDF8263856.1 peptidoglycan-binding domain-containing protein [Luteipulveratus sp. YIM 133296]